MTLHCNNCHNESQNMFFDSDDIKMCMVCGSTDVIQEEEQDKVEVSSLFD